MVNEFKNLILKQATKVRYTVKDLAPSTELDLFNNPSLVIWSGASNHTIWNDPAVNWAFRALHDHLHLKTSMDFTPQSEIELGRIQANQYSGLLADLVYIEVSKQAEYYLNNGVFVSNQVEFTLNQLKRGVSL